MIENEKHLKDILNTLNDAGILSDMILIGSWSQLFYKNIFENFEVTFRTVDLDFYVPNAKAIKEKGHIIQSFKELNFDLVRDSFTNKSHFISPDGFELEFLTRLDRERLQCIKLGNTQIYAESLPYLDIFTGNYIEVKYDGLSIKVASPSSYVLQKLLINSDRKKEKAARDIRSINIVLKYIKSSRKYYDELASLYSSLPNSWKKRIDRTCLNNDVLLFE